MNAEQSIEFNDYKLLVRAVCSVLVLRTISSACVCKLRILQVRMMHIAQLARHASCGLRSCLPNGRQNQAGFEVSVGSFLIQNRLNQCSV